MSMSMGGCRYLEWLSDMWFVDGWWIEGSTVGHAVIIRFVIAIVMG